MFQDELCVDFKHPFTGISLSLNCRLQQLKEMFPQMDDEVLRSVLVAKGGSVEKSINELLSMS